MVQTRDGVKNNEWIIFMRACSEQYKKQKAEAKAAQDSKAAQNAGEAVSQASNTAFWKPENSAREPKTGQLAD